jgi:hypothetical protein
MLPELFDHQDQNVRASAKGLTLELCRWIGKDPVKSILFEKMRDTMVSPNSIKMKLLNNQGSYFIGFNSCYNLYRIYFSCRKKSLKQSWLMWLDRQSPPVKSGRGLCFYL